MSVNPVQYEIEQNSKNPQWKELYLAELQKQSSIFKDIVGSVVPFAEEGIEAKTLNAIKANSMKKNIETTAKLALANPQADIETIYCLPNGTKMVNGEKNFLYNYEKSYKDPIQQRPGVEWTMCVDQATGNPVHEVTGVKQSPINLDTTQEVTKEFKDDVFETNYEVMEPQFSYKFTQGSETFVFPFQNVKHRDNQLVKNNFMHTSTISLFDPHIKSANFYGMQFHFHAPSEHSFDGKLLDLEMHIVHKLQKEHSAGYLPAGDAQASQFSHGVLGFLFKIMPESYFEENKSEGYHDKFLADLVNEEKLKAVQNKPSECTYDADGKLTSGQDSGLDLSKFVSMINTNRRWTFQGSLTTAPAAEGIMWNVVEQVIPIRESTADEFVKFRKIQEGLSTAELVADKEDVDRWALAKTTHHDSVKCQHINGNQFMRIAVCNRKVQDQNDRPVYHIDA